MSASGGETKSVAVALGDSGAGDRSYEVVIGPKALDQLGPRLAALKPGAKAAVVSDETVAGLYGARALSGLAQAGIATRLITVAPGEASKSFAGLEQVCDGLLDFGIERGDVVIALGGGVIGDLAGLAAGLLKRGVDYIQVPTTLLAQVDSSVGGKTAIDARAGKNLIGLFHQPRLVLADLDLLSSLPAREIRAGLAEVVKYGLIDDAGFFHWCVDHAAELLALDPAAISTAVAHSVEAKARIVAADEKEAGARALLNFGHTFGHAIETLSGLDTGALLHGEAVAIGMDLAFAFSHELGLCPQQDANAVTAGLARLSLRYAIPAAVKQAGIDAFLAAMAQDKKNEAGRLTLILARGIGAAFVMKNAPTDRLAEFLKRTVFLTP
jgi:3-dehydroquinate synthase